MTVTGVIKHHVQAFLATAVVLMGLAALVPASSQAAGDHGRSNVAGATADPSAAVPSGGFREYAAATGPEVEGKPEASPLIAGGREANLKKHPWLVQITLDDYHFCHGVLIHAMVVMTTAHCLVNEDGAPRVFFARVRVFAGRTQLDSGGEELFPVGDLIHPDYDPATSRNDLAFLALDSPAPYPTLKVAGVREKALWRTGRIASFAGFGAFEFHSPPRPVLRQSKAPILSDSVCGSRKFYGDRFDPATMLCAGNLAKGGNTCWFDQGSPLIVPIDGGGHRIVGLTSWGDGCETPGKPTVFTRLTDPEINAGIIPALKEIKRYERFPDAHSNIQVVGWGAKPAGCSAAKAQLKKVKKAKSKAKAKLQAEKKRFPKVKRKFAKAKAGLAKAKAKVKTAARKVNATCK